MFGGNIMTFFDIIKFLLEVGAILLGCYLIYREKDLIKFEKKVFKYTKAFFKACAYTLRDKIFGKPVSVRPTPITVNKQVNAYEELLCSINFESETNDVLIAS